MTSLTYEEAEIYFCAFRYCLGRKTYIVSSFCSEAKKKLQYMHEKWINLMIKEITEAEESDTGIRAPWSTLGGGYLTKEWLAFRKCCEEELQKRGDKDGRL